MSFQGIPIVDWWRSIQHKHVIGSGKSSIAYAVMHDGIQYIVRTTNVVDPMQRKLIEHEIKVYSYIMQHDRYKDHVSELLFSYCPTYISNREDENLAFFIFPFYMGLPLDSFLRFLKKSGLRLNPSTDVKWRDQLNATLNFLESIHIVHRDFKPANMYLDTKHDRLLLFDFELACISSTNECRSTSFFGTRNYASPNAIALLHTIGFPTPYTYTRKDDEHAIQTMFQKDITPLVGSPNNV